MESQLYNMYRCMRHRNIYFCCTLAHSPSWSKLSELSDHWMGVCAQKCDTVRWAWGWWGWCEIAGGIYNVRAHNTLLAIYTLEKWGGSACGSTQNIIKLLVTTLLFFIYNRINVQAAPQPEDDSAYPQSQFNLNCTNYTMEQLKDLNLARGIAGAVSLLTVTIWYFSSWCSIKHTQLHFMQHLFVHLTIVTCLRDVSFMIQIEHQFEYYGQEQFCVFVGLPVWYIFSSLG